MIFAFRHRHAAVGVLIATLAALYRIALGSSLTNDDFSHLTLSRQLLGGDLPVRDFVESGITLTYGLSAAAQILFGHRLLAEALVVAIAFFVSTYAVFALVRTLTGSTVAAAVAAVLLPLAGPRGYSYPKIVVYAVAAVLWWSYVRKPSRLRAGALGAPGPLWRSSGGPTTVRTSRQAWCWRWSGRTDFGSTCCQPSRCCSRLLHCGVASPCR